MGKKTAEWDGQNVKLGRRGTGGWGKGERGSGGIVFFFFKKTHSAAAHPPFPYYHPDLIYTYIHMFFVFFLLIDGVNY